MWLHLQEVGVFLPPLSTGIYLLNVGSKGDFQQTASRAKGQSPFSFTIFLGGM